MKIFLINLDKNSARLSQMDAQLSHQGVKYERYPAIYGKALDKNFRNKHVNAFLWWCHAGRYVMDGEIGVALSHQAIYRKMISEGIDCACILEDDVVLEDDFAMRLNEIEKWIAHDGRCVVLLSNYSEDLNSRQGVVETTEASFADGYVITKAAAAAILSLNHPLRFAADTWGVFRKRGHIKLYYSCPRVCHQEWTPDYESDVCDMERMHKLNGRPFKCIGYYICRTIGKIIDCGV